MTLNEFLDFAALELDVRWVEGLRKFQADFKDVEVKDGGMLASAYGSGKTRRGAIEDYCKQIQGETLVHDAYSKEHRREMKAPVVIQYVPEDWES